MRAGVGQGGVISPVLFSLYVKDIPTPSRHIELAQYAGGTALVAMSMHPALLVKYLETHLSGKMAPRLEDCDQCREECSRTLYEYIHSATSSLRFLGEEI